MCAGLKVVRIDRRPWRGSWYEKLHAEARRKDKMTIHEESFDPFQLSSPRSSSVLRASAWGFLFPLPMAGSDCHAECQSFRRATTPHNKGFPANS